MRKGTLHPNAFTQAKQRIVIQGMSDLEVVTRGEISIEKGVLSRSDKTQVPLGRTEPGEFDITVALSDKRSLDALDQWWKQSLDRGSDNGQVDQSGGAVVGIDPNYKKTAMIVYHRLYQNSADKPENIELTGCWIKSMTFPDYDMSGEDESMVSMSICYDDAQRTTNSGGFTSNNAVSSLVNAGGALIGGGLLTGG